MAKFPHLQDFIGVDDTIKDLNINEIEEISGDFEEHLEEIDLNSKIRVGSLIKGKLRFGRNNMNEATVMSQFGFEIKIVGEKDINRAIHGDQVGVELLDEEFWLSSKTVNMEDEDMINDGASENTAATQTVEFRNLVEKIKQLELCPVGRIKGIVKRNLRNLAGQVKRVVFERDGYFFAECQPVDPRYPSTILRLTNVRFLVKNFQNVDSLG